MSGLFTPRAAEKAGPRPDRKLRFLFRSRWGESLALARRVVAEGHEAKLCISAPQATHVGDGLIEKCAWSESEREWADAVIFDCNDKTLPDEYDALRHTGKPVLGSGTFAHRLEKDRAFAAELAAKGGLHVPEWETFSGAHAFDQAAKWMDGRTLRAGVVFKANTAEVGTQVADDRRQMLRLFDYLATRFERLHKTPDFQLQAVVEGTEVSVEGWWTGTEFCCPNATLERNKLMAGDIGEKIGSAGETVWMLKDTETPLFAQVVAPLGRLLKDLGPCPLDVNTIVDAVGTPWWLEFTPRFGYGAIFCLMDLVEDFAGLLYGVACGETVDVPVSKDFATGICVHIPPYPTTPKDADLAEDLPITGFDADDDERETGLSPAEIKLDAKGLPVTSGPFGWVGQAIGTADTIADSASTAYAHLDVFHVPKMRYRNDIGVGAAEDYRELQRHHLLDGRRVIGGGLPLRGLLARRS